MSSYERCLTGKLSTDAKCENEGLCIDRRYLVLFLRQNSGNIAGYVNYVYSVQFVRSVVDAVYGDSYQIWQTRCEVDTL
jgi:hypothetical protein